MSHSKFSNYTTLSLLGLLIVTGGCAATDNYDQRDNQMSQEMSGGGGRGGGMGRGGGHQGPPPGMDNSEESIQEIPEEAFVACEGQEEGTEVQITLPDGKVVDATCSIMDDHLVALPKR